MRSAAHAKLYITQLLELMEFTVTYLNDRPVGKNVATPSQMQRAGEASFEGLGIFIKLGPEVLAATAIRTEQPHTISYEKGIRYERTTYTSSAIRRRDLDGVVVETFYEPSDPSILYADINGERLVLTSSDHSRIQHLDALHREAELIMQFDTGAAQAKIREAVDLEASKTVADIIATGSSNGAQTVSTDKRGGRKAVFNDAKVSVGGEESLFDDVRRISYHELNRV
jgi:hypothetical protein